MYTLIVYAMADFFPGTHIYIAEYRCDCCGKLPPDFYIKVNGKPYINPTYQLLFYQYEKLIKEYGERIPIGRGYSCTKKQLYIYLNGILMKYGEKWRDKIVDILNDKTMTPFSVHPFGLALDVGNERFDLAKIASILKRFKPKPRIGSSYKSHVHFDHGWKVTPRYSRKLREGAKW